MKIIFVCKENKNKTLFNNKLLFRVSLRSVCSPTGLERHEGE